MQAVHSYYTRRCVSRQAHENTPALGQRDGHLSADERAEIQVDECAILRCSRRIVAVDWIELDAAAATQQCSCGSAVRSRPHCLAALQTAMNWVGRASPRTQIQARRNDCTLVDRLTGTTPHGPTQTTHVASCDSGIDRSISIWRIFPSACIVDRVEASYAAVTHVSACTDEQEPNKTVRRRWV